MKKTKSLIAKTGKLLLVFGVVFSQLSFPLSVLADEFSEENNQDEMVNQEEANNTNGKIINEQYEINLIEEEIIPNEEELPNEEASFTVELIENGTQNLYIIKNKLNMTLTVKQLKDAESNITAIMNQEEIEVADETEVIKSGYQVTITAEDSEIKTYTIIMLGDYDEDGMVTENDKTALLEILKATLEEDLEEDVSNKDISSLDLNKDGKFDILDVTHPIFTEGTWENIHVATDNLENYLMASLEEVYVEEEIKVDYLIEGFNVDSLVGIQGTLSYDETLLELIKIEINGTEQEIEELVNGKFIYLLENYNQNEEVLMTLTFKAILTGTPIVSIEEIVASIGGTAAILDSDKVSTSFENLEYGKGGNEEDDEEEDTSTTEPITPPTTENTESVTEPVVVQTVTKPVLLSSDNDIKSLIIEGYEIEFNPNTYEYSIKVKNDVTSLNLSVLLNSDKAIYYVEGNENFEVGENLVYVVVKAENGSTKTYTIRVEKEKKETVKEEVNTDADADEDETEEKNNTSKTIIIILIVLVIIGLIYVIFKDDEEDTKEVKKETNKENKKESKKEENKKEIKKETKKRK